MLVDCATVFPCPMILFVRNEETTSVLHYIYKDSRGYAMLGVGLAGPE